MLAAAAFVVACDRSDNAPASGSPSFAESSASHQAARPREEEPAQWTLHEVARRLTDGGLVVTDSGRTPIRQSFLAVQGHQLHVSGSDLQVFIYPDPRGRKADSDLIDTARVAPRDRVIDWVATPHLIASGNLLAMTAMHGAAALPCC